MNSKSEQRRLAVQLEKRLCCVCETEVALEDRRVWAASGLPVTYLCCQVHTVQAREMLSREVAARRTK